MKLSFHPLTPARWPDLEALFMAKGCAIARGCWCMYYRESGKQTVPSGQTLQGVRKQRLQALAGAEPPAGIIAYKGTTPVGWLSFGPRSGYAKLERSPVMKPVDDQPVWSVVCFVVPPEFRHQGVATALLKAAVAEARARGARLLEAYPVDKATRGADDWDSPEGTVFNSGYTDHGFLVRGEHQLGRGGSKAAARPSSGSGLK